MKKGGRSCERFSAGNEICNDYCIKEGGCFFFVASRITTIKLPLLPLVLFVLYLAKARFYFLVRGKYIKSILHCDLGYDY